MFSRPCQDGRSWGRGWAIRAVLLVAGWGLTAQARQTPRDSDMPTPLAESLREAGIVAPAEAPTTKPVAPEAAQPAPKPTAAATPAPAPAPLPAMDDLPQLPGADAPAPAPAPAVAPAPEPVAPAVEPAPVPVPVRPPTPAVSPAALAPAVAASDDLDLPPLPGEVPIAPPAPATPVSPTQLFAAPIDANVDPANCASCGNKLRSNPGGGYGGCSSCGGGGQCIPGRANCGGSMSSCNEHYMCRLIGNLYECICCPDPCYQPGWIPEANAAFFQDFARPRSMSRFRWDHGFQMRFPDRNEFFWARQGTSSGGGRGPKFPPAKYKAGHGSSKFGQAGVNYDQLYYYTEAASAKGSLFFEIPYRSNNPSLGPSMSGFADLNFGTKSLLFDCELVQVTFQFKSFMPTGQPAKGLGTGHVSLEPSLLMSMRLGPESYLQGQFAEWIPLGGDSTYAGALMHYHLSFNQVLFRPLPDVPIIGTFEFNGWSFQDGAYTNAALPTPQKSSGNSYLNLGTGLRTSICDKVDFGGAVAFPISNHYWANPLLRFELRILY